jgi:hypothetical protein
MRLGHVMIRQVAVESLGTGRDQPRMKTLPETFGLDVRVHSRERAGHIRAPELARQNPSY